MDAPANLVGQLLLALPGIGDPRFDHAVIAMCAHDPEGAMGIGVGEVVRGIGLHDIFAQLEIDPGETDNAPVHVGGPVEPRRGFVLHSLDWGGQDTIDVAGLWALSGHIDILRAIAEGRHIDVIEMDAASNTGVDSMREIIDAVRYAAVSARYKIYIIDEVHMLSNNAFNALLKTLEEPPAHVKFLFATTEIRKVPVTVLSRCQRFDLKRVPHDVLVEWFGKISVQEKVEISPEALAMLARAADGSVRDGLSMLDQAIAHGGGVVDAAQVLAQVKGIDFTHFTAADVVRHRIVQDIVDAYDRTSED